MNRGRISMCLEILRQHAKSGTPMNLDVWATARGEACAIGLIAQHPTTEQEGLRLRIQISELDPNGWIKVPYYAGSWHFQAVAHFLGIHESEAIDIFSPEGYPDKPTLDDVIKRLAGLLEADSETQVPEGPLRPLRGN